MKKLTGNFKTHEELIQFVKFQWKLSSKRQIDIAKEAGVSKSTVQKIVTGKMA